MKIGLRVDVDTYRGTKLGVPALCRLFNEENIKASFFFSVGPDNMGRHLWRLLKPAFLWKMLRTKAASLYGWDIILMGTFWPGPLIGRKLADVIRKTSESGHEMGLHAWDHHAWQARIERMDANEIYQSLKKGFDELVSIIGRNPDCSAVPGWKSNDIVLKEKAKFPFIYNSDCRGESIFYPVVDGVKLPQPQVPVSLPTYDEALGRNGITNENYNAHILSFLKKDAMNVLTIHAEAEGISCLEMFRDFIKKAKVAGAEFVPLGELVEASGSIEEGVAEMGSLSGREGWVSCQKKRF
ncbi:MAG: 4-deoxy-4-formamido-L-arabinose-phosphoundecaprenol deformylase [Lentisphaerae bacterium GWF2_44_16]|nr:MAG: 4-deoxy-4-formamido-L-arabinose-phosphoundecaprenol deformylase [Lentisphaerae bacterium GWF2_44_16]